MPKTKTNKPVATKKSQVFTFDISVLKNAVDEANNLLVDPRAEDFLNKWVAFKKAFEVAEEKIKEQLKAVMAEHNTTKIEGEVIKVYRRYFGDRFEATDLDLALGMGLATEETKIKLDTKAIDAWIKKEGEMPECIKLKDRTESIVITGSKDLE